MKKVLNSQSGYALMVVLVAIVVIGLLTPVMLTTTTNGLKNTKSTNDNINARYIADSAYQENLNKITNYEDKLLNEVDIKKFMSNHIINSSGELNEGKYNTISHPVNTTNPEIIPNYTGDSNKTLYRYYLRSIGEVSNQTSFVDYTISFEVSKLGSTTILYEYSNEENTKYRLPIKPDNLQKIAKATIGLNGIIQNDINNKYDGTSSPNIVFRESISPIPKHYKSELTESETITQNAKVSKVNLKNNKSLTVQGDLYVENDFIIGNNGTITVIGDLYVGTNFNFGNNASLKVTGDVIVKNSITLGNNIYFNVSGSMFVQGGLTVENNASDSKIGKSLYVKNNITFGNNGELTVTNDIVSNNLILNNNNFLKTGGEVIVKNEFKAYNNAEVELEGGLEVGTQLTLNNNVTFKFARKLYITNELHIGNNAQMLLLKKDGTNGKESTNVIIEYKHLPINNSK